MSDAPTLELPHYIAQSLDGDSRQLVQEATSYALGELVHSFIGTEHLLRALFTTPTDSCRVIALLLQRNGVTQERVQKKVFEIIGRGQALDRQVQLTPRLKKVFELAMRQANYRGSELVAPDDLFIAVLSEGEGMAVQVICKLGRNINFDVLTLEVLRTAEALRWRAEAADPLPSNPDALSVEELVAAVSLIEGTVASVKKQRKQLRRQRRQLGRTLDDLQVQAQVLYEVLEHRQGSDAKQEPEVLWGDDVPNDPILQGLRGVEQSLSERGLLTPELQQLMQRVKCTYVSRP